MMRLCHPVWAQPLELVENQVHLVALESPRLFRSFYSDLLTAQKGETGALCLSKDYEPVAFSKYAEVISPPYLLDFGQRKLMNKLYALLQKEAYDESLYLKTTAFTGAISAYLHELILASQLPLSFDEIRLDALFKACDLQIQQDGTLVDALCTYFDLMASFFNIHIFVCFHLREYLEPDEVAMLYQHGHYQKYQLVLVESRVHPRLPEEKITIIDKDLCEIY